jgi:sortase (surface protein transpeptidase)
VRRGRETQVVDVPTRPRRRTRRKQRSRRAVASGIVGVGLALFLYAGYGLLNVEQSVPYADVTEAPPVPDVPPPPASAEVRESSGVLAGREAAAVAAPSRLIIEAIGVDHPVIPVALRDDGQMEIPDDVNDIGWYSPGVKPGEIGSAVLAGHVDSRLQGPGAFFDLRLLEEGDLIMVVDDVGIERSWVVERVVRYPKDEIPLEELFRWDGDRGDLVLITCGGEFDRTARSYVDNLVVHTTPLDG